MQRNVLNLRKSLPTALPMDLAVRCASLPCLRSILSKMVRRSRNAFTHTHTLQLCLHEQEKKIKICKIKIHESKLEACVSVMTILL